MIGVLGRQVTVMVQRGGELQMYEDGGGAHIFTIYRVYGTVGQKL